MLVIIFFFFFVILLFLLLFVIDVNDSVWFEDTQVGEHFNSINETSCFDKILLIGLSDPEFCSFCFLNQLTCAFLYLFQRCHFLLVLHQLHRVNIFDDFQLLTKVTRQQCKCTVNHFAVFIQDNIKKNTNQIFSF
jgi:hypothetical protein